MNPFPTQFPPMRYGRILIAAALLTACPLWGTDFNFNHLVSSIENRYQVRHEHIPLIGFASFCAHIATRGGIRGLHLADFEDTGSRIPTDDFDSFVHSQLGEAWNVIVRSHEKATTEDTIIYARADGNRFLLLIADLENGELSIVKVGVDANRLPKWLSGHQHQHHATL
jgi:hypothetical protein